MAKRTVTPGHHISFASLSFQYYLAGRSANLCYHVVAGNLFHHALEFLFKYRILRAHDEDEQRELQQGRLRGHRLTQWWPMFKDLAEDSGLSRFDDFVERLDLWEDIRYPGFPNDKGNRVTISLVKVPDQVISDDDSNRFDICLEEMDEAYTACVLAGDLNPRFGLFSLGRHDEILALYHRENRHPLPLEG